MPDETPPPISMARSTKRSRTPFGSSAILATEIQQRLLQARRIHLDATARRQITRDDHLFERRGAAAGHMRTVSCQLARLKDVQY